MYVPVACGKSRLVYQVELVEGKDAPRGASKEFDDRGGKTVGLLLRMTQPYWYSGICLVLDSGFCVLKALIELRKVGLYAAAVIKKRRYWPKYIDGDAVAAHFEGKDIGSRCPTG
jgi:Transposase IS4